MDELLKRLARSAAAACDAALARVWVIGPGDQCPSCPMRPECPDQTRCLHLEASAGVSTRTDGQYRRFPIGARRVGQAVVERTPFVERRDVAALGLADPAWLAMHRVRSFVALPLESEGQVLGVLAIMSRREITDGELRILAFAAEQAAAAIVLGQKARSGADRVASGAQPGRGVPPHPARSERRRRAPDARDLRPIAEIEREVIERALAHTGGRISGPRGAAKILGLHPNTLASRMLKLAVRRPRPSS